jgi:hypothetical protein
MITRLNISLPGDLAEKIKKTVPKRGLSKFLAEAAEERIKRLEREKALKELLEAPPAFTFLKGKDAAVKWVRKLRREDEKRLRRVWGKRV